MRTFRGLRLPVFVALLLAIPSCASSPGTPKVHQQSHPKPAIATVSTALVLTQAASSEVLTAVSLTTGSTLWSADIHVVGPAESVIVAAKLHMAYVLGGERATLTPIALENGAVGPRIAINNPGWSVSLAPNGTMAYVVNAGSEIMALPSPDGSTVTPVDLETRRALSPISVGDGPAGFAFANTKSAYVSLVSSSTVERVNVSDRSVGPSLKAPEAKSGETVPGVVTVSPNGRWLLVGNLQQDLGFPAPVVNLLDLMTQRWRQPIRLAGSSNAVSNIVFSPDSRFAYILARSSVDFTDAIYTANMLNGSVIQSPFQIDALAGSAFALAPSGDTLYVAAGQADGTTKPRSTDRSPVN